MYRFPINAIAVLVLAFAGLAVSMNAAAGQYLIFKGHNVTHSCLDGLIQFPANQPVSAIPLLLSCTQIAYQETDTLFYDPSSHSCMTHADFAATTKADIEASFIQYSSTMGPLQSLLGDVFIADENAVVVFDPKTGEVTLGESTACDQTSSPPPPLPPVNCTPESITLSSQAEVDSFQADHGPGCNTIVTALTVDGASITDLTPLSGLTTGLLNSTIKFQNTSVTSLAGLDNLSSVHWIELSNNSLLTSIASLSALTNVTGPLFIQGNAALTNLDGLDNLTILTNGALWLAGNASLTDLGGVSGLTHIGASLIIENNDSLTNLNDLIGLATVAANMSISDNDALTDISGLSGLVGFSAALDMRRNSSLVSLGNLPNFTDIGGLVIWDNNALTNLDGLSGLTTIGDLSLLGILYNDNLTNIDGLAGLVGVDSSVVIEGNFSLSQCSVLKTLLDQVDDALPGPGPGAFGIPDVNGEVTISENLDACDSIADIVGAASHCPYAIFCDGFEGDKVANNGEISGAKWDDQNGNATRDPEEPGLPGVTIFVDLNNNGVLDQDEPSALTDVDGNYNFTNQAAGTYRVREVVPEGFEQTFPTVAFHEIVLGSDTIVDGVDFGNMALPTGEISGAKWNDQNANADRDPEEPGLPGVTIYLDINSNGALDQDEPTAVTDANGGYLFDKLAAANYRVREVVPDGYTQTSPTLGYHEVMLESGQVIDGLDFGNQPPPTGDVSGAKWIDLNGDGTRDNEPGLDGVTIYVDLNSNGDFDHDEPSTVTDLDGNYVLTDVAAGPIRVREQIPHGFNQTFPTEGYHDILLESGQSVVDLDFGNIELITENISGGKWDDVNGNGVKDSSEVGMGGVTIYVDLNSNGVLDQDEPSAVTNNEGFYGLSHVEVGLIQVREVIPNGFVQTFPALGYHEILLEHGHPVFFLNFGNQAQ